MDVLPSRAAADKEAADGPLPLYRAKLARGELGSDPAQALAVERLQALWQRLRFYEPAPAANGQGLLGWLLARRSPEDSAAPNGLYLAGAVGRGKSMLMDLFFATAPLARKRRVHFDRFMQDVHARLHAAAGGDPIPPLADAIARENVLLCFDEFQINDVADALLLGRLFAALFARGVIVVATSNTVPDDLFKGQPGRDAFLPFIEILKSHLDLLVIEGGQDWRRERLMRMPVWHVPADARARAALDAAFAELGGEPAAERRLIVMGRTLPVPRAAGKVARFDFASLCETPLGPGDYLALATHFETLVLDAIPRLDPLRFDAARRFITLIDALYDHRVKLVASAAADPDELYPEGEGSEAFRRTASRLIEMQTREYLALPHLT
ncbi:MAG TPA: cell division protein ZapE [Acetobacteraceae bacterium]|nr:cell division protein ZapE [Acetobacteraceae bacterium]